jgi:Domain of unknown function (DUF5666)
MNNQRIRGALPVLAGVIAAVLLGCGGGGGDATPPPAAPPPSLGGGTGGTGAQAPVVSSGTMAKGSIILNGIRYDDSATSVTDDRNRTATQLANGMAIKLRGRSDDNVTGQADRVDVENELRASIQSISTAGNTQSFVAAGLVVIVDSQTIYSNVAGFSSLTVGQRVEVHGPRDTGGNVRATRVEAVGAADGQDELRGTVSNVVTATRQFTLNGNVTVNYSGATFSPAGASATSLVAGALVEIHGSLAGAVFTATQIDLEDTEDEAFRGRDNEKTEFEGYVSGFTAHPGSFTVNGRSVQTTASTRFVGGTAADLANNVKVEAEGTSSSGTLVASKIEFKQSRIVLDGRATAVDAGGGTVVVLGQTVRATAQTRIETRSANGNSTSLGDLVPPNECVEVRAYIDGGAIVAEEMKEPSGCGKELVQARVVAKNDTAFTLTFLSNLNASLANASVFRNAAGQAMSRAEFFAAIVPASANNIGTLVKVKGNSLSAVEEAEIEN